MKTFILIVCMFSVFISVGYIVSGQAWSKSNVEIQAYNVVCVSRAGDFHKTRVCG